jgi:hypothetical protein
LSKLRVRFRLFDISFISAYNIQIITQCTGNLITKAMPHITETIYGQCMKSKRTHPLLIRGEQLTEKVSIWTLREHPHTVTGCRRGFEVRVYHYPAPAWQPYLVTITAKEGWVMDATDLPTAAAAEVAALQMLSDLADPADNMRRPVSSSEAAQMAKAHAERVEHITTALITAIDTAGATYPQAQHALTRAFGALIGANAETDADRAAAVSIASRAIAGCAENASLIARHGRKLRSTRSRMN